MIWSHELLDFWDFNNKFSSLDLSGLFDHWCYIHDLSVDKKNLAKVVQTTTFMLDDLYKKQDHLILYNLETFETYQIQISSSLGE